MVKEVMYNRVEISSFSQEKMIKKEKKEATKPKETSVALSLSLSLSGLHSFSLGDFLDFGYQ